MKPRLKSLLASILLGASLSASLPAIAADTVCDDNGGAGYPITDGGVTNLSIPFNFGDISRLHDVNVTTDITHTWVGDLTVRVTSPESGTQITMFERPGTAAGDTAPADSGPYGCNGNDINVTFDDESPNPRIENAACTATVPVFSGTAQAHNAAPNNLSAWDGESPNGNWGFRLSDSANQDTGTLNQVCLTVAYAAVTFDKWVSSNASCSDTIDSIAVAPGTDVYFCYSVENPSTETFTINVGDWSDDQGHDLSALERTYNQNDIFTYVDGPIVAGSAGLPVGTTVNNASVTGTFATPNFNGTLTTPELATAVVADPVFNTSTKTVVDLNGGAADPGDVLQYTITINESAGIFTPNVQLTDVVDANLNTINITTLPAGATDNTVGNNIDISGITVPASGSVTVVFEATIAGTTAPGTNIDNTATISHAASAVSADAIAPRVVVSAPALNTSTKLELDVDGAPALAGDLIRYTITINETGGNPATNVTVTDTVDANLVGLNIVSIPAGAVDNTVGNNIDISNISVAASGSATIVFEANIAGTANPGTNIDNTATIVDLASGVSASPAAGTIIVGSTPTSGVKQLYLDNLNGSQDLTRVAPGGNTTSGNIGGGASITIDQTPVFQAPFTISGGGNATSQIWIRRRGGGGARTAQLQLFNGNTGALIGTNSQTWNAGGWQLLTFPVPIATDQNFAANDFVRIVVSNTSANNRNIQLSTLRGGTNSQLQMQSSTVINVDAIGVYDAAYPSTTQYPSYTPGSTVFVRATVSDPFGNADITSANITITDPTPTVQVNNVAMTSVATPSGAIRVYEFQYTIPATPDGFWGLSITANEGNEGTVSHNATSTMIVGTANISISKSSTVVSDPINAVNPKAIPGAIVEYVINVDNSGFGYADNNSIILTDPLDVNTRFFFGSPVDPAQFTNGVTPSGLSYNFIGLSSTTDDIAFSNNGGSTFITPSVDGSGFDTTVPPINFIRINPKGSLRGTDGVNNPSFNMRFRLRVN